MDLLHWYLTWMTLLRFRSVVNSYNHTMVQEKNYCTVDVFSVVCCTFTFGAALKLFEIHITILYRVT